MKVRDEFFNKNSLLILSYVSEKDLEYAKQSFEL